METITICPVCSNNTFKPYLNCKDYLVSNQMFSIVYCTQCSFRLTSPRPDAEKIGSYYKAEQYVSHNDESRGLVNTAYRMVRRYTLKSKLDLINKLNKGKGRILDVGCGTGTFLETCQKGGWQITGMEPDTDARSIAARKLNTSIFSNLETVEKAKSFDVITLWHVLEHVSDLNGVISQLYALLSETGTLLIAVPNSDSYDANYFKQFWAAYDVPRHLHHFTPSTIESLMVKHDFTLVGKRPMLFDAFYIAMLSTKYRTGETDYLESIRIGLASNASAKKTGHSSSLIYLFNKA